MIPCGLLSHVVRNMFGMAFANEMLEVRCQYLLEPQGFSGRRSRRRRCRLTLLLLLFSLQLLLLLLKLLLVLLQICLLGML